MYQKWVGTVDKLRGTFDPQEVAENARQMRRGGLPESDEENVSFPDIPLEIELSESEIQ